MGRSVWHTARHGCRVGASGRRLHLYSAQQHVVWPLILEAVLAQHSGNLAPVPNAVKENVGCDLVFAGGHHSGSKCLEGEDSFELTLRRRRKEIDQLSPCEIAELED